MSVEVEVASNECTDLPIVVSFNQALMMMFDLL